MYAVFVYFDSVFVSQEKKRKKNERWVKRVMWRLEKKEGVNRNRNTHTHACIHTIHTRTLTQTHHTPLTIYYTQTHTYIYTNTHVYKCTHTYTHKHTHNTHHTHTPHNTHHTHTHTHTHTIYTEVP